ncbi:MAG: hypothetical protein AABY41_02510, partial [Nitrospirota bacterium]
LLGLLIILLTLSSPFWGKRLNLGGNLLSIILLCITFITSLILMLLKSNVRTRLSILLVMVLFAKLSWASLYFPYHSDHLSHYRNAANRINEAATLDVMLYDYGVDNPHLAYYLNRPLKLITSVDEAMNEKGAVIFMKKKTAEGLQTNNLSYMGEVKARIETLVLYRVK